jgi:predicted nucleic acid-binding protein
MRIYLEAICFLFLFSSTDSGNIIRDIFHKAKEGKITIVTSAWSFNQYLDEITFLYKDSEEDAKLNVRVMISILSRKLSELAEKDHYVEVGLTKPLLDSASLHILNSGLTSEQAIHVFSAQLNGVDTFVVADETFLIESENWKSYFDIFHLNSRADRIRLQEAIKKL